MDLNIGKHCAVPECHQLDFLPFPCPACELIFCLTHKTQDSHNCVKKDESPDLPTFSGDKSYKCSYIECCGRELMPVVCDACKRNFCLNHRHQTEHNCEKYEAPGERMQKTKEHVQNIIDSKPASVRKKQGRKSKATAAKVALMKIKQKSVGDKGCPETERVYLNIILPLGSTASSKPMYFSKKWSVGRSIDQAADAASVKNENNNPNAKKLRLIDQESGSIYPVEATVESQMSEEGIINGGTLILEYVENDTTALSDLQKYHL